MRRAALGALLPLLAGFLPGFQAAPARPPNVILVLVDDMGWTDLACFGSGFYETPAVDRLAAGGMRFTQAYSACTVCSPSRASLMTGKYPPRVNITDWIPGHKRPKARLKVPEINLQLALEEVTVAEVLKENGYATASVGKWHLGGPAFFPDKQGFDLNIGGCDKGQPPSYFSPYRIPTLQDGERGEYLTDRLALEAVRFIEATATGRSSSTSPTTRSTRRSRGRRTSSRSTAPGPNRAPARATPFTRPWSSPWTTP